MRKPWKIIVGFALLGLAIAGASYAHAAFYDYTKPMNWRDGARAGRGIHQVANDPQAPCPDVVAAGAGRTILPFGAFSRRY